LERLPPGYQPFQGPPEQRLAKLVGVKSPQQLWAVFDRLDLIGWCPEPKKRKEYHDVSKGYTKHNRDGHTFPLRLARLAAGRLLHFGVPINSGTAMHDYALVVLCGRQVAAAFGLKMRASVPWAEEVNGVRFLVMPHPSGVSHLWNDAVCRHRAAAAFSSALAAAGLQLPQDTTPASLPSKARQRTARCKHTPHTEATGNDRTRKRWRCGVLCSGENMEDTLQMSVAADSMKKIVASRRKRIRSKTISSRFFHTTHTAHGMCLRSFNKPHQQIQCSVSVL
jgi:hypothetical protein